MSKVVCQLVQLQEAQIIDDMPLLGFRFPAQHTQRKRSGAQVTMHMMS